MKLLVDEIAAKLDALDYKVDNVIAFVLHEAAQRQRRLPIDDPFLAGQRDALADLIDPDKQETT